MRIIRPLLAAARESHEHSARILLDRLRPGQTLSQRISRPGNPPPVDDLAILGGGITGLSSAYFCSILYPEAKISLYESSDRLGGWIKSSKHNVNGGTVIFEHGPRSLRPDPCTLSMIKDLGLENELLITPKTAPAARNRFVWYDDRLIDVRQGPLGILSEPLLRDALMEILSTFTKVCPKQFGKDETIAEFMRRRGCNSIADNLLSALIHGIYAGDIEKLSMRSVFPSLIYHEDRFLKPSIWLAAKLKSYIFSDQHTTLINPKRFAWNDDFLAHVLSEPSKARTAAYSSVYTLRGGLETLVTALVKCLQSKSNVKLITNTKVAQMSEARSGSTPGYNDKVKLTYSSTRRSQQIAQTSSVDMVISTIPSMSLAKLAPPLRDIFTHVPAATVCVVNLWYDQPGLLPLQGFGFLMPRTIPVSKNPEGALGVVFDSDATPELDTVPGTKLTVMLGGPFWSDYSQKHFPSNSEAVEMAKSVVAAHLNITQTPRLTHAELHRDCIPQYHSGHVARMQESSEMMSTGFWSKIRVAGSWYNGIGLNDCIFSAYGTSKLLGSRDFGNDPAIHPFAWLGWRFTPRA